MGVDRKEGGADLSALFNQPLTPQWRTRPRCMGRTILDIQRKAEKDDRYALVQLGQLSVTKYLQIGREVAAAPSPVPSLITLASFPDTPRRPYDGAMKDQLTASRAPPGLCQLPSELVGAWAMPVIKGLQCHHWS